MSSSTLPSNTPPTSGSTNRNRNIDVELAQRNVQELITQIKRHLGSVSDERILQLASRLRSFGGGPAQEPNTENQRSNGDSTIVAQNMHELLDAYIQALLEVQGSNESEEGGLDDLKRALDPFIPIMTHAQPCVSVAALPPEDRFCCICRMEFCDTVDYTDITTEIHDDDDRELCVPIRLRCGHIVGDNCLGEWIGRSLERRLDCTCPVCRVVIRRGYF